MRKYIFPIVLLLTFLHGQDSTNIALKWAVAGQMVDLVMTEMALANGYDEINPLMTNRLIRITAKIGASVALWLYAKKYPENKTGIIIAAIIWWLPVGYNTIKIMEQ